MNPISTFFLQNIIFVYFFYGLVFFTLGVVLFIASRRPSEFQFARAIRPLAIFGLLHGLHEWISMFQKIAALTHGYWPTVSHEMVKLILLVSSFVMLAGFGIVLLNPGPAGPWWRSKTIIGLVGIWATASLAVNVLLAPGMIDLMGMADVLSRYSLGLPAAMLGVWALMVQQRTFREHDMPQFGRDLVWCAATLFLYGVVGQLFAQQTPLAPTTFLNSVVFLQWFGIPVELFQAGLAAVFTFYITRALQAFELENQRRLETANRAKLAAQAAALEAERQASREMERLNEELRLTARELSLLLDLSNLLATPMPLQEQLFAVLQKIVHSLAFSKAGMIMLTRPDTGDLHVSASTGFSSPAGNVNGEYWYHQARQLGEKCVESKLAMCLHQDGQVIAFLIEEANELQECRLYKSPTLIISLPLVTQQQVIGCLVLAQPAETAKPVSVDEFRLIAGIAQQLGLSIENARLYQEAQRREKLLQELLRQVVGAQEAERQRIARELHDATGQSLTAIALGLKGVEALLNRHSDPAVVAGQIRDLQQFSANALGELRHIISDLRPSQLDDLGLVAALRWYIQNFERRTAIPARFILQGEEKRLVSEYETVLFRIAQEALTNIAKHAEATQVQVKLELLPRQVHLTIEDNGKGFNPEEILNQEEQPVGWGLVGMIERAQLLGGICSLTSAPGQGTCVQVSIPLMMELTNV
ncbi:MAG: hypothetical protein D6784_17745 [Chloroflexi bacterium]|nr:MAG: hypothetical protein D6784_17745 [Chloroflexota bacterium]